MHSCRRCTATAHSSMEMETNIYACMHTYIHVGNAWQRHIQVWKWRQMCMHTCIHTYMWEMHGKGTFKYGNGDKCVYVHTHTYTYMHSYMHTYIHVGNARQRHIQVWKWRHILGDVFWREATRPRRIHMGKWRQICGRGKNYIHMCTYVRIHTCMCASSLSIFACLLIYIYIYIYLFIMCLYILTACVHTHIHTHT
jgi:hypothetical protein